MGMLCFSSSSPAQGAGCYPGRCCFQELIIPIYFKAGSCSWTQVPHQTLSIQTEKGWTERLSGYIWVSPRINFVRVCSLIAPWFPYLIPAGSWGNKNPSLTYSPWEPHLVLLQRGGKMLQGWSKEQERKRAQGWHFLFWDGSFSPSKNATSHTGFQLFLGPI